VVISFLSLFLCVGTAKISGGGRFWGRNIWGGRGVFYLVVDERRVGDLRGLVV